MESLVSDFFKCIGLTGMTCLVLAAVPAQADVIPTVSGASVSAVVSGSVPNGVGDPYGLGFDYPIALSDFAIDVGNVPGVPPDPDKPTALTPVLNVSANAENTEGAVEATVGVTDIDASVIRARSAAFTDPTDPADPTGPPLPVDTNFLMTSNSAGTVNATLSTDGLAPSGTAVVDLALHITGSIVYEDPNGTATITNVIDPSDPVFDQLDASVGVSALFAIGEPIEIVEPVVVPVPLPLVDLFNGSAVIQPTRVDGVGIVPRLVRSGSWADPARDADFTFYDENGVEQVGESQCTSTLFCRVDVSMSVSFPDVQSAGLGFGEQFDVGLIVSTSAEAFSDHDGTAGRSMVADFFSTAGFEVALSTPGEPTVTTPIPEQHDLREEEGAQQIVADLADHFTDGDGDALTFSVVAVADPNVLSASIGGAANSTLSITPLSGGATTVTIRASDLASGTGEGFVDDTFNVTTIGLITGASVTPGSLQPGATTTYDMTVTNEAALANMGVITIAFPYEFDISGVTLDSFTAGGATLAITHIYLGTNRLELTVTSGSIPAGTNLAWRLGSIVNPTSPGDFGGYLIETSNGVTVLDDVTVGGHTFADVPPPPQDEICFPIKTPSGGFVLICL